MKKERFEAITDAILAIVITLMVLEIKLPELTLQNLPEVFQHLLIYAISFTFIAIEWINHHNMFANAKQVTIKMVWINFAMLFFTSLLPLATEHISENFNEKANHIFFAFAMGMATLFYTILQQMAHKGEPLDYKNWLAVVLFALSVPLSFVSVYLSAMIFVAMPAMYFFLTRRTVKNEN